jgi:sulfur carrier protein ThiS
MNSKNLSKHGQEIERALQEAVADAIEEHRRTGKPIVVARDGKPVKVDPKTVRTVREERAEYGEDKS